MQPGVPSAEMLGVTASDSLRRRGHQSVSWLELFFDLVFVAWLTLVNSTLMEQPRSSVLLGMYAAFGSFTIWMIATTINNREPDQGLVRSASMVALMLLILLIALTLRPEDGLSASLGAVLLGAVYLVLAGMLADVRWRTTDSRLGVPLTLLVLAALICFWRAQPSTMGWVSCIVSALWR